MDRKEMAKLEGVQRIVVSYGTGKLISSAAIKKMTAGESIKQ